MSKRQSGNGCPHENILKASPVVESVIKSKAAHRCHTHGKLPRVYKLNLSHIENAGAVRW